jgi:hypothetical protein
MSTKGTPDKAIFTKVRTKVSVFEKALLTPKRKRKKKRKKKPEARDLSWHERFPI